MRISLTDVGFPSCLNSSLCQRGAGGDFSLSIEGVALLNSLQVPIVPVVKGGLA